jgi:hypothetical protein
MNLKVFTCTPVYEVHHHILAWEGFKTQGRFSIKAGTQVPFYRQGALAIVNTRKLFAGILNFSRVSNYVRRKVT